jgi:hypothetical protein
MLWKVGILPRLWGLSAWSYWATIMTTPPVAVVCLTSLVPLVLYLDPCRGEREHWIQGGSHTEPALV